MGLLYIAIALILCGLNLRTVYSSYSAVLEEITNASGMSGLAVMLTATLPVTCLGVFAPCAPLLAKRFGTDQTLFGAMLTLTLALVARGLGGVSTLYAGALAAGAAIAIVNVLLPSLVKRDFAHRLGLMSGLYTMSMCASAALGAGFTHPIFEATGSWQLALGFWAIPAAVATLIWAPIGLRMRHARTKNVVPGSNVWRSSTAWQITLFMVMQSMMSFSVFAWLAPILRSRDITGGTAGVVVAVSIVLQMAGCLLAPTLAVKLRSQSALNVVAALMTGAGFALSIFGPIQGIWLWTLLLGFGQGSLTALALTMIILRTRDSKTTVRVSGMMQGIGYGVGSAGTLLVGHLHQVTGRFVAAGVMFLIIGSGAAVFGWLAGRARFVDDDLAQRDPKPVV